MACTGRLHAAQGTCDTFAGWMQSWTRGSVPRGGSTVLRSLALAAVTKVLPQGVCAQGGRQLRPRDPLLAPQVHSNCAGSAPCPQLMLLTQQAHQCLLAAAHILLLFAGSACFLQQVSAPRAAGSASVPQLVARHVLPCTSPQWVADSTREPASEAQRVREYC